jgi:hypothetical protein
MYAGVTAAGCGVHEVEIMTRKITVINNKDN